MTVIEKCIYGIMYGLSAFLPVSASANSYLFQLLLGKQGIEPLLSLAVHTGCMAVLLMQCGKRLLYIQRQMRIARTPARSRQRQPDMIAVLDGRLLLGALLPMAAASLLSWLYGSHLQILPVVTLLLAVTGILVYIPQYFPGGNRESRGMGKFDSLLLGLSAGLNGLPGFSGLGAMLSAGQLRGCDKTYILETSLLMMVPMMAIQIVLDVIALVLAGLSQITLFAAVSCGAAGLAAFLLGGAAVALMRYLAVKVGYSSYAYFSFGMAMLCFILYLSI